MADIADVSKEEVQAIYEAIQKTKANILTRLLCASFLLSLWLPGVVARRSSVSLTGLSRLLVSPFRLNVDFCGGPKMT